MSNKRKNTFSISAEECHVSLIPLSAITGLDKINETNKKELFKALINYLEDEGNVEKTRLHLAEGTEVKVEFDVKEAVDYETSLDGETYEIKPETTKKTKLTLSLAPGGDYYLIEKCTLNTKVEEDEELGVILSIDNSIGKKNKESIIAVKNLDTDNYTFFYECSPNKGYAKTFKGDKPEEVEVGFSVLKDTKGLFIQSSMSKSLKTDSIEIPGLTITIPEQ